jgi:CP family cyanate transporter-like MFS transporter
VNAESTAIGGPVTTRRADAAPMLMVAALALVAFSLRTPTASLPPLLGSIERTLGLSGIASGALTSLPVLCMALCAPPAHRIAHRFGAEATTLAAIGLLAAGTLLRLGGASAVLLFAGTVIAGIGIAACGVTLPTIIKGRFAPRPGVATAAYSVPMMLGAAVAPMMAVGLGRSLGSWEASLASWAVPALAAAVSGRRLRCGLHAAANRRPPRPPRDAFPGGRAAPGCSPAS